MKITSLQNPKVKNLIKLRKKRGQKEQGFFVVEGRHEIHLAEQSNWEILELYLCEEFSSDKNFTVHAKNVEQVSLIKSVFCKISNRENPDGYLAIVRAKKLDLDDLSLRENPIILVLDGLEKPGNLGAILRTADGANVDAVIISNPKTDIFNPNVIRSSLGTIFTNQIALGSTENCINWLKEKGISIVATTPRARKDYTNFDYKQACAIVIGPEHEGLSEKWLSQDINQVKIPMLGRIDSLNASVSAAILVYEALRQRDFK